MYCDIHIWSSDSIEYAESVARRLGIYDIVGVLSKTSGYTVDLVFDNQDVKLGKANVKVR